MAQELTWTPFLSLLRKEVLRFWSVISQTLFIPLINSTLYLLIFGVSLGKNIQVEGAGSYLAFLIPGLMMMGVLNNAFQNSSSSIATSKFHGDLEDLRISPLSEIQILAAMGIAATIRGFVVGGVTFIVGQIFHWVTTGHLLPIEHPLILFMFLLIGGITFAFLGIAIAFHSQSIDQLSLIGGFVLLPLMYLGGVFFSLEHLHPFWKSLSHINPLLYFINGVRYGMLGQADISWEIAGLFSLVTLSLLSGLAFYTVRNGSYSRW